MARATENVTISNCYMSGDYQLGSVLDGSWKRMEPSMGRRSTGRIKCGTESNGGFKGITISNCIFESCRGLALETVDGALCEDITVIGVTMRDIRQSPFFFALDRGCAVQETRRWNFEANYSERHHLLWIGYTAVDFERHPRAHDRGRQDQ